MSDQKIEPPKITKPIQLLAAWLAGLILINGSFLATATALTSHGWASAALVAASITNVPVFLVCVFLLQTKFRPEMQEDVFYSKYLELNTGKVVIANPTEALVGQLRAEIFEQHHRNAEVLSGLELNLKSITQKIGGTETDNQPIKTELLAVTETIDKSVKMADAKIERAAVQINDLLPEFIDIRRALRKRGILIKKTFGSTSKDPEVPQVKIIGFGRSVPIWELRDIVQVCQSFGFNRIHFAKLDVNEGGIYIGSYVYRAHKERQPVPITKEIRALLEATDTELEDIIDAIEIAGRAQTMPYEFEKSKHEAE